MKRQLATALAVSMTVLSAVACGATQTSAGGTATTASVGTTASDETITLTNCEEQVAFPKNASRLLVYDTGMISMILALGASDKLTAVAGLNEEPERLVLGRHYGQDTIGSLKNVADEMPPMETIIAQRPDVVVAGWNYGYQEATGVTPTTLREKGIAPYTLSESCRPVEGQKERGTMDPWTALSTDLTNLGKITGTEAKAKEVNADIDARRAALEEAAKADKTPNVLLFDSGDKTVFTSGKFGGPQAVIETAGARNVMDDVADTWTAVSWERVAATKPDAIVFVSYGEQTLEQKIALLESNAATKDLGAVKQKRYLNLPYAMWVSSPLNIDAAEQLRAKLEAWQLVPASDLPAPAFDDSQGTK